MKMLIRTALVAVCFGASAAAFATQCPSHYVAGEAPVITKPALRARTKEVCFEAYGVMHSGVSRTPLWAAEHLTRDRVEAARDLSRRDSFHPEPSLPPEDRSELSDYARSGYDRGHMAPNGDFGTRSSQGESFSLANMVPQVHANNAGIWAAIEGAVREMAVERGEIYVVTGPAFVGTDLKRINQRVLVPTNLWKVVYDPSRQQAGAYVITNDETRTYSVMSVSELERMVGLQILPSVPQQVRDKAMDLPVPSEEHRRRRR